MGTFLETQCRVIAVSCGIKISAVHHLVLSQHTRLTDGRTDRIATAIPCVAYMPHGKNAPLPRPVATELTMDANVTCNILNDFCRTCSGRQVDDTIFSLSRETTHGLLLDDNS